MRFKVCSCVHVYVCVFSNSIWKTVTQTTSRYWFLRFTIRQAATAFLYLPLCPLRELLSLAHVDDIKTCRPMSTGAKRYEMANVGCLSYTVITSISRRFFFFSLLFASTSLFSASKCNIHVPEGNPATVFFTVFREAALPSTCTSQINVLFISYGWNRADWRSRHEFDLRQAYVSSRWTATCMTIKLWIVT